MYTFSDYLKRGALFANNNIFQSHKKLSSLMLYATDLCDSRCKHCLIWQKRPVKYLPFEKIIEVMGSSCVTKNTHIGLEGGEFLLHPDSMKILEWFTNNHPKFDLLSNCLKDQKVIEAVQKFPPSRLYISLDGGKETYLNMRGKDGYDNVIKVIEGCKDIVPISIMFTLSPYNNFSDLKDVLEVAKKYKIDVRIGVYNNISFFDTIEKAHESESNSILDSFKEQIPAEVKDTFENYDYLWLYDEWRKNNVKLGCRSILDSLVIHPDGNVPICQNLNVSLGNIYEKSLDEIFNSLASQKIQKDYKGCNQCWINFHRKYDIVLMRTMEKFMPKSLVEKLFGDYSWCEDKNKTYSDIFESKG